MYEKMRAFVRSEYFVWYLAAATVFVGLVGSTVAAHYS